MATSFGRRAGKFASRAAQGALLSAPTANPYVIGGTALASGLPALFEEDREFDPKPFRKGFARYAAARRSAARRSADEAGAQAGALLASKGFAASSPLTAGITAGQRRLALQRTEDILGAEEGQLEADLAREEAEIDAANAQDIRDELQGVGTAALALGHNVATKDSPLRELLGLPQITPDPAPIIIRTGGDNTPDEMTGTDDNTPVEPIPDVEPTVDAQRVSYLRSQGVNPNSTLGKWWRRDPEVSNELINMLPPELLQSLGLM